MCAVSIIDCRDGDGITTTSPGVAFEWITLKRPRETTYRSRDFALLADSVLPDEPLSYERMCTASAYQFLLVRVGEEVR